MAINLLDVATSLYDPNEYDYRIGGNGTRDYDSDGKNGIDCSGLASSVLRAAGYEFPQRERFNTEWLRSKAAENYFDVIEKEDVQPGDIIVWGLDPGRAYGHTGFVDNYDPTRNTGVLFGSNSSTDGPNYINIPRHVRLHSRRRRMFLKPDER